MKRAIFVFFLVFFGGQKWAASQFRMSFDLGTGFGMNPALSLLDQEVGRRNASVSYLDYSLHFPFTKKIGVSFGLGGKYIINHARLGDAKVKASTLRSQTKLVLYWRTHPKISWYAGVSAQNNRDFEDILTYQPFNFRFNAEFSMAYQLANSAELFARISTSLKRFTDAYLLNDPMVIASVGVKWFVFQNSKDE